MSIFKSMNFTSSGFVPFLNTGTLLDISSGAFLPGMNNTMILNGGLSSTNGFQGRPQTYKTSIALAMAINACINYKDCEMWVHDSEYAISSKERISGMSRRPIDHDRIRLTNPSHESSNGKLLDLPEVHQEIIRLANHKLKHKKDLMVEIPFLNPKTGKPYQMIIPTKAYANSVLSSYDKKELGDSSNNTIHMKDGNLKSQFIPHIVSLAAQASIYFVLTAHIGDKTDMNPMMKSPKILQHMKSTDKPVNVGTQFTFLMSNLVDIRKATLIQNSAKTKSRYPIEGGSPVELSKITSVISRCKNNVSGTAVEHITSQSQSLLIGVTNFDYLSQNNPSGLQGSNTKIHPWFPEDKLANHTVRGKLRDSYELSRAIEILAQLCFIRNNWNTFNIQGVDLGINPDKFVDDVLAGNKTMISDICNSRGYWTYDKDDPRKYMSVYDIIYMLKNDKAPKKK